ncbi:hypothetical protein IIC65_08385 [Candidatus Sumerlaeota bacterium]|nr:hypothetical protein [Candidatus Sumerlaeota bacterium]
MRTGSLIPFVLLTGVLFTAQLDAAGLEGEDPGPETPKTDVEFNAGDIRVRIAGHSGKIQFWNDAQEEGSKRFLLEFNGLYELPPGTALPPTTDTLTVNTFNTFANQDFTFSDFTQFDFPGFVEGEPVASKNIDFTAPLMLDGQATTLTVRTYLFLESGAIDVDGESFDVEAGYLKFTVEIEGWPFLDMSNELVLEMAIKTPGMTPQRVGEEIELGDEGFLVLASTAVIDSTEAAPDGVVVDVPTELIQSGSVGRLYFIFPSFSDNLTYDPLIFSNFQAVAAAGDFWILLR